MNDIITWLVGVENSAASLYEEAASAFREDKEFSQFLGLMGHEEREHESLLQKAHSAISNDEMKRACFSFDDDFRRKIETPFTSGWGLLKNQTLTKNAMVNLLAEAEFSEWNEVLVYTLDLMNALDEEIQKFIADIEQHRKRAQEFIASLPGGDIVLQRVKKQYPPDGKRVLIIESNHAVARMLEALAGDQVEVLVAKDGDEGLSSIRQGHFDLVVAEIDLPGMNGIEVYRKALDIDRTMGNRFVFFTGTENQGHLDFVRSSKALLLPKPSPVKAVCKMMNEVLDSSLKG